MNQSLQQETFQKIEIHLKKIAENMERLVSELQKLNARAENEKK